MGGNRLRLLIYKNRKDGLSEGQPVFSYKPDILAISFSLIFKNPTYLGHNSLILTKTGPFESEVLRKDYQNRTYQAKEPPQTIGRGPGDVLIGAIFLDL